MPRVVVIGGVAAGTSAASQAKRRQPAAEVIVLERGPFVSYGACGIPYNLQDPEREVDDLVVISAERFRSERQIDVRLAQEVLAIDGQQRRLTVRDRESGREYGLSYDKLVVSTGARATPLAIPGAHLPGVQTLRELTDAEQLKRVLDRNAPRSALLIGAGYIGMELAETLRARGLEVCVVEKAPQVVPGFAPEIVACVEEELRAHAVRIELGCDVLAIERNAERLVARTARGALEVDLIVIAVGLAPEVRLAEQAGIRLGAGGAIAVDLEQRTSLPDVWAAGDCAESRHLVTGQQTWIPLGTTANKQGKVAGANAAGAHERFPGIVGTAAFKLFELEIARTGLGQRDLERLGLPFVAAASKQYSRAASVPGGVPIRSVLYADPDTGKLLGAQMVGREGVSKRIDVFATALHAGMTLEQVRDLDLSYAPPFAPVYDPVLIAAHVAEKARRDKGAAGGGDP